MNNILELTNNPFQSLKTNIDGTTLLIDLKANSRTSTYFATVRLVDGTTILSGKELAEERLLTFNSNSTFIGGLVLVPVAPYSFPNIGDGCVLTVVT